MDSELIKRLINSSFEVMKFSYCPYSNFQVGATVICEDGSVYSGTNIETATYSGICAERVAFSKAIADGHRKFRAVAITSNLEDSFITPCGVCRQFMVEFGTDLLVIMAKKNATYEMEPLSSLLPKSFGPYTLNDFNNQKNK